MGLKKTFTLKESKKLFPAAVTKIRSEDLMKISTSKLVTKKERKDIEELTQKMMQGFEPPEMLITRKGKKLSRIGF